MATFRDLREHPNDIVYVGRRSRRDLARSLLGLPGDVATDGGNAALPGRSVLISEFRLPGTLAVPAYLHLLIPLGKPMEKVMEPVGSELRKRIRQHRARYHAQQTLDIAEIDRASIEMLQPYAVARHGASAASIEAAMVRRMARRFGRLDLVYHDNEVVGCQLGTEIVRNGKRLWSLIHCGYREYIFSDSRRLREANSINHQLALEWALGNGFDYLDMGACLARPDDGLLQWKCRWGGMLDLMDNHVYYHLKLPKEGAADFLWHSPLFAIEHHGLALHIGLPTGISDDDVLIRYRQMGFGGLVKIHLHCARPPGEALLGNLRGIITDQKPPPPVETIPST
jgi:hypothetical protein